MIVSSAGADINAKGFYLSLKGQIESDIIKIGIKNTYIFRPSLLLGARKENRVGEKIAQVIMPLFSFLLPKKYRPISAESVAKSMINLSKTDIKAYFLFIVFVGVNASMTTHSNRNVDSNNFLYVLILSKIKLLESDGTLIDNENSGNFDFYEFIRIKENGIYSEIFYKCKHCGIYR